MKRLEFECKLLSDVVIKSTSATEGNNKGLDYIPGSKFLGIAANNLYDTNNMDDTLNIFHNGNVFFGDAHIKINDERSLKVPSDWFYKKGEDISGDIFLYHKLTKKTKLKFTNEGVQLKQARKGYFAESGSSISLENNFAIKSAYDSENRKAKESQMYGYFSFPKGSTWCFYVDTEEDYVELLIKALVGRKRIGRSRSAEFGLSDISFIKEIDRENKGIIKPGEISIYAESNLCFYDDYGQNTLQPTVEALNLPKDSVINWAKTQIRSRKYQTWNGKRYNRDADRMIIEKGSVIIVELKSGIDASVFENGIGAHKNEGFGHVLINPGFLFSSSDKVELKLNNVSYSENDTIYFIKKGENDDLLIRYLENQVNEKKHELNVDELVNTFIKAHKTMFNEISHSQWGQVRNYAKHAANEDVLYDLLFLKGLGYFMHGQTEHKWRKNNRRGILEDFIFGSDSKKIKASVSVGSKIDFIQKLSSEMGKSKKIKKQQS